MRGVFADADLIKMIAVFAPHLALTIGPYTSEASELIASHLAVLTRTDNERHFLRTVYPSEEYRDSFQSDQAAESDLSDETECQDDQTDREVFNADLQYVWHADDPPDDEPNVATGTGGEEMDDVEMFDLHTDNMFLSLI
jgi:hypothetical protein